MRVFTNWQECRSVRSEESKRDSSPVGLRMTNRVAKQASILVLLLSEGDEAEKAKRGVYKGRIS